MPGLCDVSMQPLTKDKVAAIFAQGKAKFCGHGRAGFAYEVEGSRIVKVFAAANGLMQEAHNLKLLSGVVGLPVLVPTYLGHDCAQDGDRFLFHGIPAHGYLAMSCAPGQTALSAWTEDAFLAPPPDMQPFIESLAQAMVGFHDAAHDLDLRGRPVGADLIDMLADPKRIITPLHRDMALELRAALQAAMISTTPPVVGIHGDLYMENVFVGHDRCVSAFIDVANSRKARAEIEFDSFSGLPSFMERLIPAYSARTSRPFDQALVYLRAAARVFCSVVSDMQDKDRLAIWNSSGAASFCISANLRTVQHYVDKLVKDDPKFAPMKAKLNQICPG